MSNLDLIIYFPIVFILFMKLAKGIFFKEGKNLITFFLVIPSLAQFLDINKIVIVMLLLLTIILVSFVLSLKYLTKRADLKISYYEVFFIIVTLKISLIGLLVGFLNDNNLIYLLGDFWQFVIISLLFIILLMIRTTPQQIQNEIMSAAIILAFIETLFMLVGYKDRSLTFITMLSIPYCIFNIIQSKTIKKSELFLFILFTVHILVSSTRTLWIGAILGILILSIYIFIINRKYFLKLSKIILFSMLSIGLLIFSLNLGEQILERISPSKTAWTPELSVQGRNLEAIGAFNTTISQSPVYGLGLGAEFDNPRAQVEVVMENHFIHNIYAMIFLRTGSLGLGLIIILLVVLLKRSLFKIFKKRDFYSVLYFSQLFALIICSFSQPMLIGITPIFSVIAYGILKNDDRSVNNN